MASKDGKRRPPRPRIDVVSGVASDEEAAAIAKALEQFLAETAPAPGASRPVSRWQMAALREGVEARRSLEPAWPTDSR